MCYNCGCGVPTDDMGDPNNITESTLKEIAEKRQSDVTSIKEELFAKLEKDTANVGGEYEQMFKTAADSWGQSVEEAKKETISLLKKQLHK